MATTKTKSAYQKALEKKKTGKSSTTSTKVKNINGAAANDGKSPYEQAYAKARSLRQLNGAKHVDFQGNAKQAVTDYTKSQAEKQQKQYQQQVNNAATKTANQVATTYGTGIANTQGFKNYMQQLSKAQENATGTSAKVPSISSVDAFRTSPKQDNYTSLYTKLSMNQPTKTTSTTNNATGTSTGATDYKKNTVQNAQTLKSGRKTGQYDNENNLGTSYEEGMSDAFINNRIKKTQKEINDLQTTGDYADYTRQQEYKNAQQTKKQLEQRLAEVRRDGQNGNNAEKRKQEVADLQAQIANENAIIQRYEQQYGTKSGAQIGQEAMTQKNTAGLNNIQAGTAYMGNGFNTYMQQLDALNGKGTAGTGSTTATNQYGLQNTPKATTPFMKSLGENMGQTIKTPIKNEGAERYSLSREQYDNAVETKEKAEKTLEDVEGRLQDAIDTGNTAMAEQLQQQKNAIQAQIDNENIIIERTKDNATAELTLEDKQTTLQNYQEVQNNRGKVQNFEDEARNAADFDTLSDGSDATQPTGHQDYYTIQYQLVNLGSDYEPYGRDQDITDTMKQVGVDLMTGDEKAVYNYYYNSGDKTKAEAYLTALSPTLRARRTEAQNAESYNYSYEHPVLGTLESAATNVVNGAISTPFQWIGAAMGSNDTDTVFYDYLNRTNYLRSGAGEKIADEVGNVMGEQAGDVAQWLYNTGNSAIDSFVSAAIGSVMMGAPIMGSAAMTAAQKVGTQAISLGLMSSQAASQTLKEKLDSGMDSGKAILYSAVYGGIESLTEIYSLETLMGDPTKFGLYLLKNFAAEGSEEIAGDFLRPAVDWVIARATDDKTELEQTYESYLKQGMTAKEATMRTLGDWGVDTILDGLAGGISGVGSSVVYGGVGKLQEMGQTSSLGGEIISNDTTSNIISVAETLDQNGKAYKLAQEMQEGKKKRNAYNVGKLLQLTMEETGGAAGVLQEQFTEDITKRLQEKGETENVEEVAAAAAALMSTGTVTAEQAAVLSESKYGMEVLNEASQDMSAEAVQRRQESWKNRQTQQRIREAVQTRETNNDTNTNNQDETSTEEHTEDQQETRTETRSEEEEQKAEEAETQARATLTEAQAADTAGEAVKVQEITSTAKTGTATVKVTKGNTVTEMKLQDVAFDDERQATAYRMAAQMETPTKGQAFLQMLKTTTMPLDTARAAFNVIYDAGLRGTTLESSGITEEYRQMIGAAAALNAYEAGAQAQAKQNARLDFSEDVVQELKDAVAALPETVSEDYTGVVYKATSKSTLSQAMAAQIVLIDQVAKQYGLQVEIADQAGSGAMKGKMNGRYIQGTNCIQIGLDSDQGLLTRTLAHEMTHFIKEWNADGYAELAAFISAKLKESDGYSLQERIEEKQEQYKQIGQELTEEAALEEIVADSMFKVFENEKYLADLYEWHETLAEKIKSKLKNFAQELKNAAKRLKNAEAQAMAQQEAEHLDELVEKFNHAATGALAYNYLARETAKEEKAKAAEAKEAQAQEMKTGETQEGTEEYKGKNEENARFSLKEDGTLASLQDVDAINMTMRQEIEDNREFRDMLRKLNRVARTRGEITAAQQKDVRRIAANLIKQWSVDAMTQKTLAANLTTAFNAMANAKTTAETEIAMEAMADIAQDLIERSGHYDTSAAEQYGDAAVQLLEDFKHGKVALSEQDWKEAVYRYESARNFRKAYAGIWNPPGQKAKNSKGWLSCDDVLHNMIDVPATEGGIGFRVEGEEVGTPFDQVEAFLKAVKPEWINMEEQSLKEYGEFDAGTVATEMATKIYEEYLNMKQYTTAEEQNAENAETIKQQNKQIEELKEQMEKNREELKKTKRKLQDSIMENIDNKYKQMERREREEKKTARREIIRQSHRIANKLAAPKNGSFVPWTMRSAVEKLLQMVDFTNIESGKTSTTVLEEKVIREAMEAYMELGEVKEDEQDEALKRTKDFFNADLKEDFNRLLMQGVGKQLGDLSIEDLTHLKNIMSGYAAAIINADKLFMGEKTASLTDTGNNFIFEMNTRKPHKKQGSLAQALDRSLGSGLLKPYTVFYKLKGTEMEAVWKNLRNAEGKHIRNVQSAAGFLENTLEEFHHQETINMDSKQQRKNGFTLELQSGESIKLTREEMLTITAVYKREKIVGTQHLLKGGITLRDADKGTKMDAYHLTVEDLQKMEEALTEEEKNYRDKMVGYLSNECSEWGNEVTREMYGVEKFTEKYYIPFQVDSNVLANDPAQAQDQRLKMGSFTKSLKNKAGNTIQIVPFTELWCSHVEKMSDYNAFVLPIENMTRLMNYKAAEGGTVKVAMNKGYGKETTQYIMSFLKNLNGNTRTSDADRWYKQLSSKAKGAAVTFNMSVAFQQAGAGVRAASVINPKYITKGMVTGLNVNKSYAELEKYAPIAVLKGWGYFDTQQARGLYDRARSDWKGKLSDIAGKGAEFGDKLNWAQMWEAAKAEQEDLLKGEKEETILKAAGERFQDVIDQTQVVDSVFQRARWAYEPSHIKDAFLNFMSEPITQYNMLYRAIYDIQEAKNNPDVITKEGETPEQLKARGIWKAYLGLGRTISALLTSGALTAALKTIWTAMRDRDDDKKEETEDGKTRIVGRRTYWDKYSDAYWGNFFDSWEGIVPIFSTMWEPIQNALSGESTYSSTSNELGTQAVDYLAKFISQMQKYISGKSDDMGSALYYLCTAVSYGTGVGFNALFRDVNSVFQTALGAANSEFVFMKDGTFLGVREMANTAWDSSKDFSLRLQTAQDYYVYNKNNVTNRGGDVGNRTQSSDAYVTLGVYAYYNYGLDSDEFKQAAQAAIDQGATSDGFATSVKNRIKQTEPAVTEAAQALVDGDMELYRQKISEIMATGIGSKPAEQMVKAIYNGMIDQPEEDPGNGGRVVGKLKENVDKGSDTAAGEMVSDNLTDSMTNLDAATFSQAVEDMKTVGYTEAQIKTKITTGLKKKYRQACWDGNTETATTIGKMITGAGVGLTNEDLYDWANDTGELYTAVEENNTEKAAKIFKYLINNAKDKTATRKNLDTQLKKKYKAAEGETKTNMKALLLKLGYAESTINGWK